MRKLRVVFLKTSFCQVTISLNRKFLFTNNIEHDHVHEKFSIRRNLFLHAHVNRKTDE
jgi:hypothetical protein